MAHQRDTDDEFCDALDGSSAKFKDGSKGLDVTISYNFDLYRTILIHVFLIQVLQVVGLVTLIVLTKLLQLMILLPNTLQEHILDILETIVM